MNKELVIAAYNRDYEKHFSGVKEDVIKTVYRKGDISNLKPNEIFIDNNIGRDVHTFYYHIVNRYDTLSDITFFSQDFFEDHVSNYIEIINGDKDTWDSNGTLYDESCWFFNTGMMDHPRGTLDCDKNGFPHHNLGNEIIETWDTLFESPCPETITFSTGGHFAISREGAHKVPLNTYKKVLDLLEKPYTSSPYVMERLNVYVNLRLEKFK